MKMKMGRVVVPVMNEEVHACLPRRVRVVVVVVATRGVPFEASRRSIVRKTPEDDDPVLSRRFDGRGRALRMK